VPWRNAPMIRIPTFDAEWIVIDPLDRLSRR
jgi:hypothetical protein